MDKGHTSRGGILAYFSGSKNKPSNSNMGDLILEENYESQRDEIRIDIDRETPIQIEAENVDEPTAMQIEEQGVTKNKGENTRKRGRKGWAAAGERDFQPTWAELYPCIERHEEEVGGRLRILACCAICSWKKGSPHTMQPKLDTIEKHLGKIYEKKIVDGKEEGVIRWKTAVDCMHVRNEVAYKKHIWVEKTQEKYSIASLHRKSLEKQMRSKLLQVQTVFHLLQRGRPMLDYEFIKAFLVAIGTPDLPSSHWTRLSGWEFGKAIDRVIKDDLIETIKRCEFFAISLDEASAKDLSSWVSMTIYCVNGHVRQSHYVAVKKMLKDATALSLFEIVKENLVTELELSLEDIAKKLVCIGVDGCSVMQGHRTGLCVRIQTTLAPYALAIHCMAHRMDLAYKIVDNFKCIESIEGLVSCAASFFCRSPKRYLQFQDMSKGLTKGKKLMKTVNTRWISLYYPAKRLFDEYPALVGLMDKLVNEGDTDKASELLVRLTDLETLFMLAGLLPMLNEMNMLVKLASKETMYISEYTTARKLCCTTLECLYSSALDVPYNRLKFPAWYNLLNIEGDSPKSPLTYDNKGIICMKVRSRLVQMYSPKRRIRGRLARRAPVPKVDLEGIIIKVRKNLKDVAAAVSKEIRERFPRDELLEATAIVHPRFWRRNRELKTLEEQDREVKILQKNFKARLKILSAHFCKSAPENGMVEITGLLDKKKLKEQSVCFGATMWAQCDKFSDVEYKEPRIMTKLWTILDNSQVLCERMSEYFRLADLCQTLILGSVEDERTFSVLGIIKNKVRNRLTANLDTSLRIYSCKYDDSNFPYENALAIWQSSLDRRNRKEKKKPVSMQDVQAVITFQQEEILDGWQA